VTCPVSSDRSILERCFRSRFGFELVSGATSHERSPAHQTVPDTVWGITRHWARREFRYHPLTGCATFATRHFSSPKALSSEIRSQKEDRRQSAVDLACLARSANSTIAGSIPNEKSLSRNANLIFRPNTQGSRKTTVAVRGLTSQLWVTVSICEYGINISLRKLPTHSPSCAALAVFSGNDSHQNIPRPDTVTASEAQATGRCMAKRETVPTLNPKSQTVGKTTFRMKVRRLLSWTTLLNLASMLVAQVD